MQTTTANSDKMITLDDPACLGSLPRRFASELEALRDLFAQTTCFDEICRDIRVKAVSDDLDRYLRQLSIRAYHCTREPVPGFFATNGLRLTNLDQHQKAFIKQHGHRFSDSEIEHMHEAWHQYFHVENRFTCRDNNLWFCLTRATCESDGVDPFLQLFGGEAIHKPLQDHPTISAKLQKIGQPVIVAVRLPPNSTASCHPLAKHVINAWHRTIRADVEPTEGETFIHCPIPPRDILEVRQINR